MHVGFIDDKPENVKAWHAAMIAVCGDRVELKDFGTLSDLASAVKDGFTPDVMFVDFFIDGDYGTEVLKFLRNHFGDKVFIIAHSSMDELNLGMIEQGADASLSKIKRCHPSKTVIDEFVDYEGFLTYIKRAEPAQQSHKKRTP